MRWRWLEINNRKFDYLSKGGIWKMRADCGSYTAVWYEVDRTH